MDSLLPPYLSESSKLNHSADGLVGKVTRYPLSDSHIASAVFLSTHAFDNPNHVFVNVLYFYVSREPSNTQADWFRNIDGKLLCLDLCLFGVPVHISEKILIAYYFPHIVRMPSMF